MAEKKDEKPAEKAAKVELDTDTPSGAALAKVGPPPAGATDEELNEHSAKYLAEKKKARWG